MFDGNGWWVIFPIGTLVFLVLMMIFMVLMMSRMFGFRRLRSWSGRGMGPMGMMGDDPRQEEGR